VKGLITNQRITLVKINYNARNSGERRESTDYPSGGAAQFTEFFKNKNQFVLLYLLHVVNIK
jgi:hypothetical protein